MKKITHCGSTHTPTLLKSMSDIKERYVSPAYRNSAKFSLLFMNVFSIFKFSTFYLIAETFGHYVAKIGLLELVFTVWQK